MINNKKIFDYLFPTLSLLYVLFQTLNTMWYAIKLMKKKKKHFKKRTYSRKPFAINCFKFY